MNELWRYIVKPPYRGLPWLLWTYVVLCAVLMPYGGVFTGHLVGFDDQVRMTQVLDWVNGHGFYDRTITRVNGPEGFTTIWSRLVDIPIAAIIIMAQQIMSQKAAALVAATVMPLVELAVLFVVAPYFARPLVGKRRARLIVPFLFFSSILNLKYFSVSGFVIDEASHHPYYIILNLLMLGATARLAMGSMRRAPVILLGLAIALFLIVGIEGFPLIAGAAVLLALVAWHGNRPKLAANGAAGFLFGAVGGLLLLPIHQPPDSFFTVSFAQPSILGPILIAVAALFLQTEFFILHRWGAARVTTGIMMTAIAAALAGILVALFPDILNGAAAGLSPAERQMALAEHFEARPVYSLGRSLSETISFLAPCIIALAAGVYAMVKARGRRRAVYFCYLGFAALGTGMSNLYSRYYHHAMTTACAWLLWLWEHVKATVASRGYKNRSLWATVSFIMIGPFWMLLLPTICADVPITSEVMLFPAAIQMARDPCDSLSLADYINDHYEKDALLVVPAWLSAQFLYQTETRLDFIANYPSYDKFVENYKFFGTHDMVAAQDIATRHGIDLVAVCGIPSFYSPVILPEGQMLMGRLQGAHPPAWLRRVELQDVVTNYLLYEVVRATPVNEETK